MARCKIRCEGGSSSVCTWNSYVRTGTNYGVCSGGVEAPFRSSKANACMVSSTRWDAPANKMQYYISAYITPLISKFLRLHSAKQHWETMCFDVRNVQIWTLSKLSKCTMDVVRRAYFSGAFAPTAPTSQEATSSKQCSDFHITFGGKSYEVTEATKWEIRVQRVCDTAAKAQLTRSTGRIPSP